MFSRGSNQRVLLLIVALIVMALALVACPGQATPEAAPQEQPAAPAATEPAAEEPAVEEPVAEEPATEETTAGDTAAEAYGLTSGKPYDGTELNFLICCLAAGQFAQLADMTAQGSEFHELTGISATWADVPWTAFQERLLIETSSGTGDVDVVAWVDAWGHAIKPFLVPLNPLIERDGLDMGDYPDAFIRAASDDAQETIYGIPFRGHPLLMFYRQDVFDELGLEVPTSWQEVIEVGQQIEEETDMEALAMYYGAGTGQNLFLWLSHLWGAGSDIFDDEYRPTFNDEAAVEATQAYVDILCEHQLTSPSSVAYNEGEAATEVAQGRAAMFVNWWWRWSAFQDPATTDPEVLGNLAFAPAPGWEGDAPVTYGHIWPVGISQGSRNQEAAWEFIKYITHPEIEKRVALDKSDPARANNVVVRFSNMRDSEVNEANDGVPEAGAEVLETARTQPLVSTWNEVQAILDVGINEMAVDCNVDVAQRLDRMASEVEAVMQRGGYYD
jgi:multiple sugar transport system substrate-binding protein